MDKKDELAKGRDLLEKAVIEETKELAPILEDTKITVVKDAAKYLVAQYKAQSKLFIGKYILNGVEYPTIESKLVQSLTELQVRLDNLVTRSYDYEKMKLDLEEQEYLSEKNDSDKDKTQNSIAKRRAELEAKRLRYRMGFIKHTAEEVYKEFCSWKETVEECLQLLGVNSVEEIDYSTVKDKALTQKAKMWGHMVKAGIKTEWKPSEIPIMLDNADEINKILKAPDNVVNFKSPIAEKLYKE